MRLARQYQVFLTMCVCVPPPVGDKRGHKSDVIAASSTPSSHITTQPKCLYYYHRMAVVVLLVHYVYNEEGYVVLQLPA